MADKTKVPRKKNWQESPKVDVPNERKENGEQEEEEEMVKKIKRTTIVGAGVPGQGGRNGCGTTHARPRTEARLSRWLRRGAHENPWAAITGRYLPLTAFMATAAAAAAVAVAVAAAAAAADFHQKTR